MLSRNYLLHQLARGERSDIPAVLCGWLRLAAEHIEEWRALAEKVTNVSSPIGGSQPAEAGIRKTARELGVSQKTVQNAAKIASLPPEVKEQAKAEDWSQARALLPATLDARARASFGPPVPDTSLFSGGHVTQPVAFGYSANSGWRAGKPDAAPLRRHQDQAGGPAATTAQARPASQAAHP